MTKEHWQWLCLCAARYMDIGGLDSQDAMHAAIVCWEELVDPLDYDPAEIADDDMACWDE